MKLVVDSNVLFTYFWEMSFARNNLTKVNFEIFAPEFSLEEINKYKKEIIKKAKISEKEYKALIYDLAIAVNFVPLEQYQKKIKTAARFSPDPKDSDFFALAMQLNIPLWSNDTSLKGQNRVKVVTTKDLLDNPEFSSVLFPDK